MRKKQSFPKYEAVEILDAGSEGKAVAKVDERVIFIPYVVPGDVVDIQITRKKKSFFEGKAVFFHKYSDKRTEPKCTHFGLCGGCKWQNMEYSQQLHYKQKQVTDNFERIGKFDFPGTKPIIASGQTFYYRNKLEYTFSSRKWLTGPRPTEGRLENTDGLGFHLPQMFDRILDIDECFLQDDLSNKIRNSTREFAKEQGYTFYDVRNWEGFLRNLIIRNTTIGEWMVIVVFSHEDLPAMENLLAHIRDNFPEITSLQFVINPKRNDDISDLPVELYYGRHFIIEELPSFRDPEVRLKFNIGPLSFFQTNSRQASVLYKTAAEFADFKGDETVYDLYTGTGTIANYVAPLVEKVVGIEYIASATDDAIVNSQINGISNTSFFAGDIVKVMDEEFFLKNGRPDVIITDPPRSGMHEKVVRRIVDIAPEKVVYVSCNPATQARDIAIMAEKYEVKKIQAVDMFPHTQHVENIVLLEKK